MPVPEQEAADPWVLDPEEAGQLLRQAHWRRFVAVGDSAAQGVTEPTPGYRTLSWYDRTLEAFAAAGCEVEHRNLGERGLTAAEVRATQLTEALAFRPDLAVVFCGGNDLYGRRFDLDVVAAEWTAMFSALLDAGATVVTSGMFDITRSGIVDERYRRATRDRIEAISARSREVAAALGVVQLDLVDHPAGAEAIYCSDGLHLNARGQGVLAGEAIRALGRRLGVT